MIIGNQKRIVTFTSFLILTIISVNLLMISNHKPYTSTIDPFFQKSHGHSFSFYDQILKIEINGSFDSANWTLYRHDLIKNSSHLLINTTLYVEPVILELDIGFYSLLVRINSSNPVTVTTSYYGLSDRCIILCLFIGGIGSILVLIIFIKRNFAQTLVTKLREEKVPK